MTVYFLLKGKIFTFEGLSIQTLVNTGSLSDSNFPYASALTRTEVGYSSVMMGLSELIYFRRHSQIWKQNFMPTETENRQLVFYKPTELRKQYLLFNNSNKYTYNPTHRNTFNWKTLKG